MELSWTNSRPLRHNSRRHTDDVKSFVFKLVATDPANNLFLLWYENESNFIHKERYLEERTTICRWKQKESYVFIENWTKSPENISKAIILYALVQSIQVDLEFILNHRLQNSSNHLGYCNSMNYSHNPVKIRPEFLCNTTECTYRQKLNPH